LLQEKREYCIFLVLSTMYTDLWHQKLAKCRVKVGDEK